MHKIFESLLPAIVTSGTALFIYLHGIYREHKKQKQRTQHDDTQKDVPLPPRSKKRPMR